MLNVNLSILNSVGLSAYNFFMSQGENEQHSFQNAIDAEDIFQTADQFNLWKNAKLQHDELIKRQKEIESSITYRFLGELDNPNDALEFEASLKDVQSCNGKMNWFKCSNGTFIACNDLQADAIFESGMCL